MSDRDFAFVVGIDHYPRLKRPISGAINDAEDFSAWLQLRAGGDVQPQNVRKILSTIDPKNPTSADPTNAKIDDMFSEILTLKRDRFGRMGRRLYLFFAGHGFAKSADAVCVLTSNARAELFAHIPAHSYAQLARESGGFEQICLFADCCREMFQNAPAAVNPPFFFERRPLPCDVVRGYAAGWSGLTEERLWDGKIRGTFTYALLQALSVGKITYHQLIDFTSINLRKLANKARNQHFSLEVSSKIFHFNENAQDPSVDLRLVGTGKSTGQAVVVSTQTGLILKSGLLQENDPIHFAVPPGLYRITLDGRETMILKVEPQSHKTVMIP